MEVDERIVCSVEEAIGRMSKVSYIRWWIAEEFVLDLSNKIMPNSVLEILSNVKIEYEDESNGICVDEEFEGCVKEVVSEMTLCNKIRYEVALYLRHIAKKLYPDEIKNAISGSRVTI